MLHARSTESSTTPAPPQSRPTRATGFVIGEGRNYKLHEDRDADSSIDDAETVTSKQLGESRTGVSFGSSSDIVFAPDGTAISYGSINVKDDAGETRTVVVNAAGHIKIQ